MFEDDHDDHEDHDHDDYDDKDDHDDYDDHDHDYSVDEDGGENSKLFVWCNGDFLYEGNPRVGLIMLLQLL